VEREAEWRVMEAKDELCQLPPRFIHAIPTGVYIFYTQGEISIWGLAIDS
jgi:hypothetical protein